MAGKENKYIQQQAKLQQESGANHETDELELDLGDDEERKRGEIETMGVKLYQYAGENAFGIAVALGWGMAVRYCISCISWSGLRLLVAGKEKRGEEKARLSKDWKMWAASFAAEFGASVALFPRQYLAASSSYRMYWSFMGFPTWPLSTLDQFPHPLVVFAFGARAFSDVDYPLLAWFPSVAVTLSKLVYRRVVRKQPTKTVRVLLMMAVQLFSRSIAAMGANAPVTLVAFAVDEWSNAWLVRNTWPFPESISHLTQLHLTS